MIFFFLLVILMNDIFFLLVILIESISLSFFEILKSFLSFQSLSIQEKKYKRLLLPGEVVVVN